MGFPQVTFQHISTYFNMHCAEAAKQLDGPFATVDIFVETDLELPIFLFLQACKT